MKKNKKKIKNKSQPIDNQLPLIKKIFIGIIAIFSIGLFNSYLGITPAHYQSGFQSFLFFVSIALFLAIITLNFQQTNNHSDKKTKIILGLIFVISIFFLSMTFRDYMMPGMDCGTYMTLGKSIADGHGYQMINYPEPIPHVLYGFGYPLVLAVVYKIFGLNFSILNMVSALFLLLSIGALYLLFKHEKLKTNDIFIILLITAVHNQLMVYSTFLMTETIFLFFSIAAIYGLLKYEKTETLFNKWFWIGAFFLAYSYEIKPIALGTAAAFGLHFLSRKKIKKTLLVAAFFILFNLPWAIRCIQVQNPESPTYYTYIANIFSDKKADDTTTAEDKKNAQSQYLKSVTNFDLDKYYEYFSYIFISNDPIPYIHAKLLMVLIMLFSMAYYIIIKRHLIGFHTFFLSLGAFLQFGYHRYYIIIFPFFIYMVFVAFYDIMKRVPKLNPYLIYFWYFIIFVFIVTNFKSLNGLINSANYNSYKNPERSYVQLGYDCQGQLGPNSIIAARKAPEFYLYSGYKTVYTYPLSSTPPDPRNQYHEKFGKIILEHWKTNNVDFIVLDRLRPESIVYGGHFIQVYPEIFKPVMKTADDLTFLIQIDKTKLKNLIPE